MAKENKGMTKFYNDYHDQAVNNPEMESLRLKQIEVNKAMINAYGFVDIDLEHGFHEVGYLPENRNTRFTISESAREEILYRLAMLNKKRHEMENGSSNSQQSDVENKVYEIRSDQHDVLDEVAEPQLQIDIFGREE